MEFHEVGKNLAKISKIRIERCNLYWKRLESIDEREGIIYRLGWIRIDQDVIVIMNISILGTYMKLAISNK